MEAGIKNGNGGAISVGKTLEKFWKTDKNGF
jgi:hypothetical protein